MTIEDSELVYNDMADDFEVDLYDSIKRMQDNGLQVDVQFQMNDHHFVALVIGSR